MRTFFLCMLVIPLFPAIIIHPERTFAAVSQGFAIWRDILLPALFPFLVLTELLLGFGLVAFVGALSEPLMRTLFRLPGCAGFVLLLGCLSGYPVAARLTAQLLSAKTIGRADGERLVGIATTADPIFIGSAVAIGFLQTPELTGPLLLAHYGATIALAFCLRFFRRTKTEITVRTHSNRRFLLTHALHQMRSARRADRRKPAVILADAVEQSMLLIFMIGGLVVCFFVYTSLLTSMQWMNYFYYIVHIGLSPFGELSGMLTKPITDGIFEVTMGIKSLAEGPAETRTVQYLASAWLLSWGGLSVHAQIMSIMHGNPFRYGPFLLYRTLHGMFAVCIATLVCSMSPLF